MENKDKWSFYVISSSGTSKEKRLNLSPIIVALFFLVVLGSAAGFARSVFFIAKYSYGHFGIIDKRTENRDLINKITFFKKLSNQYKDRIKGLVAFEDETRLKFGMNTINEDIRNVGVGGPPSLEQIINESFEDPIVRSTSMLKRDIEALLRQASLQDTTFSRMADHIYMQKDRWAQYPSVWPARGRVTSTFGLRYHPFIGGMAFHEGLDIANKTWTPVMSTADGIVTFVGYRGNYGLSIKISHSGGSYMTVYAHLEQASVEEGQVVKRRERIGYIGNTGRSTGPHLHYEVRKFDKHTNPMKYILPSDIIVN